MAPFELAPHLSEFLDGMQSSGFTTLTISLYSDAVCHFGTWLNENNIRPHEITTGTCERFFKHRCRCSTRCKNTVLSKKYLRRVERFIEFLTQIKVAPDTRKLPVKPPARWDEKGFVDWLACDRGLKSISIDNYVHAVTQILPMLGYDVQQYNASLIRRTMCEYAEKNRSASTKRMRTGLNAYLKYLIAKDLCSSALLAAVPTVAHWRLSSLPRFITPGEVQQVVQSCDLGKSVGVRDRAILLLLVRLGLRASDIVNLLLSDIDWEEATLLVRGKSRKVSRLPLPQEVGDAILRYLDVGRTSNTTCEQVFLCVTAPHRPLSTPSIVSGIVRAAIVRSGIDTPPFSGAHLLRHSAATSWLRDGASLDVVSTILRHSSTDMTMHYAKIDVTALHDLAESWPEVVA
jgi:site-specific recombinase XerD